MKEEKYIKEAKEKIKDWAEQDAESLRMKAEEMRIDESWVFDEYIKMIRTAWSEWEQ